MNRIAERRLGDKSLQHDCYYTATKSKDKGQELAEENNKFLYFWQI